jgi:threonine dehydratase
MTAEPELPVTLSDIEAAAREIAGKVVRTPLILAPRFPGLPDIPMYLKLENLQRTGAFKLRGATYRIAQLTPEEARRGVVTASAGNHALGVAWAARARGVPATIVMAENASPLKVSFTQALGARVILHGEDYDDAHDHSVRLAADEHLTYVHPYDDRFVIAGQGTVGLEILDDLPGVRRIVAGVGGGGLLSGIAAAVRGRGSQAEVVGVQPKGADNLRPSLAEGRVVLGPRPSTFADGLATRQIGELPLRILKASGARAVTVDDRTIARASFLLLEQAKVLAEGAGATPLAGLLEHRELSEDGPVVLVVSGGNLDPFLLDRILFIGLAAEGRLLRLRAALRDVPGRLEEFLSVAASESANVRHILHGRESPDRPPGEVTVEVELEVRDVAHGDAVEAAYRRNGWAVERIPSAPR